MKRSPNLPNSSRCRRGFVATRLMIFIIAVVALTAVIKSFSYAAHCYADMTQSLLAMGEEK